ncbi:MAG: glycosyltransferase family 2 protein [Solirubrobacteraceae bacterium]|nr:glycosyltransferase family 2 protein [Solirubrobacteraceae bacterium]
MSVVCPMYREEATVEQFHARLAAALEGVDPPVRYEAIYVDDGSDDASAERVRALGADDSRVKLVELSRNFGHQLAITSGLDHATGDATVVIDTDLQDPPEVIPAMIDRWREGYDVVDGQRTQRPGEPRLMLFLIGWFYRILGWLSETPLRSEVGDFRLIDHKVRDVFVNMREENRYIRGMVPWIGFRNTAVPYERDVRYAGTSNYRFVRRVRLAFDAVTSFSERPLNLASGLGAIITVFALGLAVWVIVGTIVNPDRGVAGYGSLMVAILFMGGVQLLSLGLVGAYLGRVYRESKGRPLYVVRDLVNFEDPTG